MGAHNAPPYSAIVFNHAYHSDLRRVGGTNPYGENNFVLCRGNQAIRRWNGEWEMVEPLTENWTLAQWQPRYEWGDPKLWPSELLGAYPQHGRYFAIQSFECPLDSPTLHMNIVMGMVWTILRHQHDSLAKREAALRAAKEGIAEARQKQTADMLQDAYPAFTGPTSFAHSPLTRTAVQRKIDILETQAKFGFNPSTERGITQVQPTV